MNPHYPLVSGRADHRCEYCRAPEVMFNFPFEVEHIFPLSAGGADHETNLALACRSCNLSKGNHLSGLDETTGAEARIFDPRSDKWAEHFRLEVDRGIILGVTATGRATVWRLGIKQRMAGRCPAPVDALGLIH